MLSRLSPSPSPAQAVPAFLSTPLGSPAAFSAVLSTLTSREQTRVALAHSANAVHQAGAFRVQEGTRRESVRKNRYQDIVAYDRTRVLLPSGEYVNASLVGAPELGLPAGELERERSWVAAQGPTNSTIHAFLSLLLSPPASSLHPTPDLPLIALIVQLTPLIEQRREKCSAYFPRNRGETWEVKPALDSTARTLWIRLDGKDENEARRVSRISLGWAGDARGRQVTHVEYLHWGDHGVPDSPSHLLAFTRSTLLLSPIQQTPVLVHCSAGVGRTGTFLTIASILPLLTHLRTSSLPPPPAPSITTELGPYPTPNEMQPHDYVGAAVDWWRDHRCMMVQTSGQLRWCYEALRVAWEEGA